MNTTAKPQPVTVSAKIAPEKRAKLQQIADDLGHGEISHVIRAAIDTVIAEADRQDATLSGGIGSARKAAAAAERQAALQIAPRTGSQRHAALTVFAEYGSVGSTAEGVWLVLQARGIPTKENGLARRVTDLLQGGMIRHATHPVEEIGDRLEDDGTVTRPTVSARGTVYVITGGGARALESAARRSA